MYVKISALTVYLSVNVTHNSFQSCDLVCFLYWCYSCLLISGLECTLLMLERFCCTYIQITYLHDYAALHAKIHGFKASPDLELSANFGNKRLFAGGSFMFNTETRNIGVTKAGRPPEPTQ